MNRKWFGSLAALAFLVSSCAKESSIEDNVIKFNGKINNLQATVNNNVETNWSAGDQIGIFMIENGSTNTIVETNGNRQYQYLQSQFIPMGNNHLYYPVNDSKVDFIAYYPYKSTATLTSDLAINVANQSNQSVLDILYAKSNNSTQGYNKTSGTSVPLIFDHKLSKLIIKTIAGNGLSNTDLTWRNMVVSIIGMNTLSSLNLSNGSLGAASIINNIVPFTTIAGSNYQAIVIPSSYPIAGALKFNFTIGGDTYVWNNAANEDFISGKEYTYEITINKTGVVLNNVTINDWLPITRTGTAN